MPIDYKKYPSNWKTEIVPAVLDRAGNKCEVCGLSNGQAVWSVKLYVRYRGRYSYRSIWMQKKSDVDRVAHLAGRRVKKITVVLTVAHLDHDETNHSVELSRLLAMCQYCHLNYDAKEKMRRIMGV